MADIVPTQKSRAVALKESYTPQQFIVEHSPVAMQRMLFDCTIQQAIGSDLITLTEVREAYGLEAVAVYIKSWIINLNSFFNKSQEMRPEQANETALLFLKKAPFLNIAELTLFFNGVKMGEYGELAGYLDGARILNYLGQFLGKRSAELARQKKQEEQKNSMSMAEAASRLVDMMPQELKDYIKNHDMRTVKKSEEELLRENEEKSRQVKRLYQ